MFRNMMIVFFVTAFLACTHINKTSSEEQGSERQAVGSDRDAHSCITSAGYSWCAKSNQCERPWELARKYGFENTREAYDKFCNKPV